MTIPAATARLNRDPFIDGIRVVENETYKIIDWYFPDGTTVSMTRLEKGKSTRGHSHEDQSEVYYFLAAHGARMIVGDEACTVKDGDMVFIQEGQFHRVINEGTRVCVFLAIFAGKPRRPTIA